TITKKRRANRWLLPANNTLRYGERRDLRFMPYHSIRLRSLTLLVRYLFMFRNTGLKILLGAIVVIAILGLLRFKPWQHLKSQPGAETATARAQLNVGFLPVT